ncbi:eukaryotic translation initiation factor 3 subunit B [Zootermopsis nevadensis]|uniref:Eukaryotic translation initiation factor 3 subunit B n=1 Tax=Zootermopsis nevadensis TaxID=136037 RepID=A0A067QVW9_ZOONE|nr:eukaryotic translation initiation factor 3 subunit B [Zootermopsis nevadensis]KDR10090.1 Eukaryotic translation initiation factor 3 subunit B [Zootermopsis nevadensis]
MAKKKESEKSSPNNELNKQDKNENNDEEPNFSDAEGFVDNISDEELLGDLLKQKPRETDGVESVIVVDGVPQVGPERLEKLTTVINKIFSKFGTIVNEYYPTNENGQTKGYIFLEYSNPKHAQEAVKLANNHKLDRQHTFLVNLFTDFKKYEEVPDEWEPPEPQPYVDQGNLHYYMLDQDAYDQYYIVTGGGSNVQIWQNTAPDPTKLEERARWSETYVRWSPLGSYLATFHKKGVALWGGVKFSQKMRFSHVGVQFIDFSPCEKYMVTYSPHADDHPSDMKRLIIWDIRTGIEKRHFSADGPAVWPIFRWSQDDRFFARIGSDVLSVYETPSFGLLEKKSVKIPGIRDFSWSPTDNVLAYWVAEDKDVPARVTLLEIPSRIEIRAKNLFNVADCKMHWQKSGDYLCVNVNRYSKIIRKEKNEVKYSGMYYNFEIFHMREKQIPVDSVEIKEVIHAFAWEPVGSKFAIIHGDGPNISVSFYGVKTGQTPSLLKRFEKKTCNSLFWAPSGQFIVLAGLRNLGGTLEFVDTNDFSIMNSTEHFACSDVEWDPTGRYVVTAVSFWKTKVDTGFWIWSFQGKILKRLNIETFCGLQWRPRLQSLLIPKQQQEIRKNLKKYSAQFESKDRMRQSRASKELIEKRAKLMKEFQEYRAKRLEQWHEEKTCRLELRNNIDTDELDSDTKNVEEEVVEFFIKEEITVID